MFVCAYKPTVTKPLLFTYIGLLRFLNVVLFFKSACACACPRARACVCVCFKVGRIFDSCSKFRIFESFPAIRFDYKFENVQV